MSESTAIAKSPISPASPTRVEAGWEVSGRRATAALTLTDETPLAKVQVKAPRNGVVAEALNVPFGRAARGSDGALVTGCGPGEWLLLAPPGTAEQLADWMRRWAADKAGSELVTVMDLTHGRAMMRLTGERSADLLAKVCGIDLSEQLVPDGAALRSSVARLVTDIVRDDRGQELSYVLHCERSSGQYLFDALLDAGAEFGIDIDGLTFPNA